MADRFENGDTGQRQRRPAARRHAATSRASTRPARAGTTAATSQGLRSRIDYIKGLGTTAIWLTPSFKNKAVQDNDGFPSAGYHGYWITDFTQIDPHLGTNDDLRELVDDGARARASRSTSTSSPTTRPTSSSYEEGAPPALHVQGRVAVPDRRRARRSTTATTPAGTHAFPAARPARTRCSFPYHPCVPAAERARQGPRLAQRRQRSTTTAATRPSSARTRSTATSSGSTTCSPRTRGSSTG